MPNLGEMTDQKRLKGKDTEKGNSGKESRLISKRSQHKSHARTRNHQSAGLKEPFVGGNWDCKGTLFGTEFSFAMLIQVALFAYSLFSFMGAFPEEASLTLNFI